MPDDDRKPRTRLGRLLKKLRARIVASGARLLDWDGVDNEVDERRGDRQPICTNCEANPATRDCEVCEECLEDCPELQWQYIAARRIDKRDQEWKDVRDGT